MRRLGFFTRLLDRVPAAERYRLAIEQIVHAERMGFETAWIAQHHFHEDEGGLPSPFVFLAAASERTRGIRLGTGIVTLPMESALRVAEDAVVFDLMSGGRLEFGVGPGGTPSAFAAFGLDPSRRGEIMSDNLRILLDAWRGRPLPGGSDLIYPAAPADLVDRVWQATFGVEGGARAGEAGDGLMLSRTQPRPPGAEHASLADIQQPIIDAYLAALPAGRTPRIMGSRSVFVADSRAEARRYAELGLRRSLERMESLGRVQRQFASLDEIITAFDVHLGTPEDVIESLRRDPTLDRVTDLVCQVHSVDPPHPLILRSLELMATTVAPALGLSLREPGAEGERAGPALRRSA